MMLTQSSETYTFPSSSDTSNTQTARSDSAFLERVVENFIDGILILTDRGEWVQANDSARRICNQLRQGKAQPNSVPQEIWCACKALIDSRNSYPDESLIIESDITAPKSTLLRVRVRWLQLNSIKHSCVLVILEDRYQSNQNLALTEAEKYGLTAREAQVWLLRRSNYTCKEIAAKLYISLNTVKKHLKNVHAKQETALYSEQPGQALRIASVCR